MTWQTFGRGEVSYSGITVYYRLQPSALCEWKISCYTMQNQRLQYIKEIACRFMASMLGLHGNVYGIKFGCETFGLFLIHGTEKVAPVLDEWFRLL